MSNAKPTSRLLPDHRRRDNPVTEELVAVIQSAWAFVDTTLR